MAGQERSVERLGEFVIHIDGNHRFGTDAFVLAAFASPKRRDAVCDLGSGCGIIPLLLLRGDSPPAHVAGLELDEGAVALMEATAADNGLAGRFTPILGDLRAPHPALAAGSFDLVTCNPPYFVPGRGYQSPDAVRSAARQEDCCTLEEICAAAARLLRYGGRFCLCHRPERLCDVAVGLRACGLEPKRLRPVCQREGAAPWLLLWEARLGGRPGLDFSPPLFIEGHGGGFSHEMLAIYGKSHPEKLSTLISTPVEKSQGRRNS